MTMRKMMGVGAPQPFDTQPAGNASLSRRPMRRVVEALSQMGGPIDATASKAPPTMPGRPLPPVHYTQAVSTAEMKDSTFLAGLHTEGTASRSVITLDDVGRNPTRAARVLRKFAAHVDLRETANAAGEPIGTIIGTGDRTGSIHIQPHEVAELIDDLPAIGALSAHSGGLRVEGGCFFETLDRLVA